MTDSSFLDRAFAAVQQYLPTRLLSSGMHALTRVELPWFKNVLIRLFMPAFRISLAEAVVQDPHEFASFNAFFTRALKPNARVVDPAHAAFVSPVDGAVSQFGDIVDGQLFQAKGHQYSAEELLAGNPHWAAEFAGGQFITIYLAPNNYHRIHMPVQGALRSWAYVPGRLFSVNPATARAVPRLFARNERLVTIFDTDDGPLAMVLVGALFVGSLETVWAGEISPPHVRNAMPQEYFPGTPLTLEKGIEMGRFNMGSTVILLTPKHLMWSSLASKQALRMGERIATRIAR